MRKKSTLRAIHSAASNEWYSPPDLVERAREVLGSIDLDPASSTSANEIVRAAIFFGPGRAPPYCDGLAVPWNHYNVFLNPPGPIYEDVTDGEGKPVLVKRKRKLVPKRRKVPGTGPRAWWEKLRLEMRRGLVRRAIYVAYSIEQLQQTQVWTPGEGLLELGAVCVPNKRVRFWRPGPNGPEPGDQPTHASAVALLGPGVDTHHVAAFRRVFGDVGAIGFPW